MQANSQEVPLGLRDITTYDMYETAVQFDGLVITEVDALTTSSVLKALPDMPDRALVRINWAEYKALLFGNGYIFWKHGLPVVRS